MGQVEEGLAILQLVAEVRRHQGGYRGQFPDALAKDAYFRSALGGIVDDELPFHWKIADNLNYRSVVTTLVYRGTGILEIL